MFMSLCVIQCLRSAERIALKPFLVKVAIDVVVRHVHVSVLHYIGCIAHCFDMIYQRGDKSRYTYILLSMVKNVSIPRTKSRD